MVDFENEYLHIWIDHDVHLMHSEWLSKVSSEQYRHGNNILTDMLLKNNIKFWIADSAKLGDISVEDEVWTIQEVVPKIIASGISKLARLSGEDKISFNKFKDFMEKASPTGLGELEVRQYMSYKEAADWIGEINT
ncbi:hypothetical protein ACSX1A_05600 [Pontibacter sp. MBLB2868]|uniref:hypothetical protein n=1 Tax=Pontibacter sp. MBLB2868 TaxID=3451555 RepID=UPI003F74B4AC